MKRNPLEESLLKGLKYSPQTGIIYRSKVKNSGKVGPVTTKSKRGYKTIKVKNIAFKQHRLAFTFMGLDIPDDRVVDHINGKLADNRWGNLRLVTLSENSRNQQRHRDGHEPYIRQHKITGTWSARKKVNGAYVHLGQFKTKEETLKRMRE